MDIDIPTETIDAQMSRNRSAVKDETGPLGDNIAPEIEALRADDVILGSSPGTEKHSGNVRFRKLVEERYSEYSKSDSVTQKTQICRELIEAIKPGRFVQLLNECVIGDGRCREVETRFALRKTRQRFYNQEHFSNVCQIRDRASEIDEPMLATSDDKVKELVRLLRPTKRSRLSTNTNELDEKPGVSAPAVLTDLDAVDISAHHAGDTESKSKICASEAFPVDGAALLAPNDANETITFRDLEAASAKQKTAQGFVRCTDSLGTSTMAMAAVTGENVAAPVQEISHDALKCKGIASAHSVSPQLAHQAPYDSSQRQTCIRLKSAAAKAVTAGSGTGPELYRHETAQRNLQESKARAQTSSPSAANTKATATPVDAKNVFYTERENNTRRLIAVGDSTLPSRTHVSAQADIQIAQEWAAVTGAPTSKAVSNTSLVPRRIKRHCKTREQETSKKTVTTSFSHQAIILSDPRQPVESGPIGHLIDEVDGDEEAGEFMMWLRLTGRLLLGAIFAYIVRPTRRLMKMTGKLIIPLLAISAIIVCLATVFVVLKAGGCYLRRAEDKTCNFHA